MLLHITISSLFFFCSLFLGFKLAKHQKDTLGRLESRFAYEQRRDEDGDPGTLVTAHYGLNQGDVFPPVQVQEMNGGRMSALQLSDTKDTYILITLLGCKPCEETLEKMKMYNFNAFAFEMIVLTYVYPGVYHAEDKIARHRQFLNALALDRIYIVSEPEMKQLDISAFPTMMRIGPDGKVMGTYTVDSEKLHLYFQGLAFEKTAS